FSPIADTYVDNGAASTNFGSDPSLLADASPIRIAFLRFAVTGVNGRHVLTARLRLGCNNGSTVGGTIHQMTDNTWNEGTVTYATNPATGGAGLQTLGTVAVGQTVEFTLDSVVTSDGTYNFSIDTTNSSAAGYNSQNATSGQK